MSGKVSQAAEMIAKRQRWTFRIVALALLVAVILSQPLAARSREIRFERIMSEKGLSERSIICMTHDRRGFMWFGTRDGLNRYDGNTFKVYKPEPHNPNSLSSSTGNNHIIMYCRQTFLKQHLEIHIVINHQHLYHRVNSR